MRRKERDFGKNFIVDTVRISLAADRKDTMADIVRIIILSFTPMLHMFFLRGIVDGAVTGSANMVQDFIGLIIIMAFSRFAGQIFGILGKKRTLNTDNYMTKLINREFASIDYRYVEDKDIYNMVERLSKSQLSYFNRGFSALTGLLYTGIQFIITFVILIGYLGSKGILLTLLIFTALAVAIWNGTSYHKRMKNVSESSRMVEYLMQVLTNKEYASERAHFRFSERLMEDFDRKLYEVKESEFKGQFRSHLMMNISSIMILIFAGITIFVMSEKAVKGTMSVGEVVAVVYLFMNLSESIRWNILMGLYNLSLARGYHGDLKRLLNLEKIPGAMDDRTEGEMDIDSIRISDLSFSYPTGDRKVLKDVSLTFRKGRTYAIVGRNGSGKSTLVKVMSGLYKDYEGRVLIGDRDLKDMSQNDIRNTYSIMYQDSARYPVTFRENIILGDTSCKDETKYKDAVNKVGLSELVESLKEKDGTVLGKITEEATDLSGGQWQKVAMGRSIYNDSPVRIYDEPTAAMDPISESDFFESLHRISKGTTSIYITHRLASTVMADEIIVLDEGRVVETGDHESLMNKKGLYYSLFMDQRRWYEDGEEHIEAV